MPGARSRLVSVPQLLEALKFERAESKSIVFTNGCFDLLHPGHLELFETAASMGDVLVVAVNRDASVQRIKGPDRPLIPFEERALIVAGLAAVDWVVGFTRTTPMELIRAIQPDVLVKGGDWPLDRIVGRDLVEGRGGRVVTVPLKPGYSSTRLRRRIDEVRPSVHPPGRWTPPPGE